MGKFTYDDAEVTIGSTTNIVLERLPLEPGDTDRETFMLHRAVTYSIADDEPGGPFTYTVPPDDQEYDTDLASVPQLLTWLVPKSGRHLPAALVHDAMVDDPDVDRFEADRIFRDGMGDLGVGLVRRWVMWTAVSLQTIQVRGTLPLRIGAVLTGLAVVVLGTLATINLVTSTTLVPWMGDRHWFEELILGLSGAVVIPMLLGIVFWWPIRTAGIVAGIAAAVLFHVVALTAAVYGFYLVIERSRRPIQIVAAITVTVVSVAAFGYGLTTEWF